MQYSKAAFKKTYLDALMSFDLLKNEPIASLIKGFEPSHIDRDLIDLSDNDKYSEHYEKVFRHGLKFLTIFYKSAPPPYTNPSTPLPNKNSPHRSLKTIKADERSIG